MTNLPDYHWRVIIQHEDRGELILAAYEPTRAQAKQYVAERMEGEITTWEDCYIPRASWDCPVCHTHEGMSEMPNLRGDHDWECLNCMSRAWGEPMDWEKIEDNSTDYE